MLVPNQYVKVKMSGKVIPHYRELGYEVKDIKTELTVPVEHLTKGCHVKIDLICDCCKKTFQREYKAYLQYTDNGIDYCENCGKGVRVKNTIKEKYGVDNVMEIPGIKEKIKQTCLERYGVENYSQTSECKEKIERTCLEKYGATSFLSSPEVRDRINNTVKEKYGVDSVMQLDFVKEKAKHTNLKKYGVEYSSQSELVKEKTKQTCLERYGAENSLASLEVQEKVKKTNLDRYGVENPFYLEYFQEKAKNTCLEKYGVEYYTQTDEFSKKTKNTLITKYGVDHVSQIPEVAFKRMETLSKNNIINTSSQQIYIYEIIHNKYNNCILNYPCGNSCFDIALWIDDIKIDIEYDGWYWHQDSQRDRRRDEHFKSQGWKVLRIKSGHKLPTEEQLFEAIDRLVNTDKMYTQIILDDWKEGEFTA